MNEVLSLPMFPGLTYELQERVAERVVTFTRLKAVRSFAAGATGTNPARDSKKR